MKIFNKKLYTSLLISSLLVVLQLKAEDSYLPEPIIQLDSFFSHHLLLVEKSTHKLFLYKEVNGVPSLVEEYQIATGKKAGNKIFQGDFRTPEGIYHFNDFLPHAELVKRHGKAGEIYGVGAFVMNFPNPMDIKEKKTGGGIWLHSTNNETRIDKGLDSRGCIVAHNKKLIKLSQYIELNKTPIIVVQNLTFLSKENWEKRRRNFQMTLEAWRSAWQEEKLKEYITFYDKNNFFDINRGLYKDFRSYKRAVFNNPGSPTIDLKNIFILKASKYALATFEQLYSSKKINDIGKKTLYLIEDEFYNWKIVRENWTKSGLNSKSIDSIEDTIAFRPSMRFFQSPNPEKILGHPINGNEHLTAKKEQN